MRKCTYTETDLKKIRMANSSKPEDLVIYPKLKVYTFLLNFMNAKVISFDWSQYSLIEIVSKQIY